MSARVKSELEIAEEGISVLRAQLSEARAELAALRTERWAGDMSDLVRERDALKQRVEELESLLRKIAPCPHCGAGDKGEHWLHGACGGCTLLIAERDALRSVLERALDILEAADTHKKVAVGIDFIHDALASPPPKSPAPHLHQWTIPADPPIGARCECGATYFDVPGFTGPNLRPTTKSPAPECSRCDGYGWVNTVGSTCSACNGTGFAPGPGPAPEGGK